MRATMTDGFKTLITFGTAPGSPSFAEKELTPPAYDGGAPIDITTMRNDTVETFHPRSLYKLGDVTIKVAYMPVAVEQIRGAINVNQLITVTFSTGAQVQFWGWLGSFKPDSHKIGDHPMAEITIHFSGHDNSNNEVIPVFVP